MYESEWPGTLPAPTLHEDVSVEKKKEAYSRSSRHAFPPLASFISLFQLTADQPATCETNSCLEFIISPPSTKAIQPVKKEITDSTAQSSLQEALPVSKLWNPKDHHRLHKISQPAPTMKQLNPVHISSRPILTLPSNLRNILQLASWIYVFGLKFCKHFSSISRVIQVSYTLSTSCYYSVFPIFVFLPLLSV